jgi:hypothetical protein
MIYGSPDPSTNKLVVVVVIVVCTAILLIAYSDHFGTWRSGHA